MKAVYFPEKLLQLERSLQFPRRLRLLFLDAPKSYEIDFATAGDREEYALMRATSLVVRHGRSLKWVCRALTTVGDGHNFWEFFSFHLS